MFVRKVNQAQEVKGEARYLKSNIAPRGFLTRGGNTKENITKTKKCLTP